MPDLDPVAQAEAHLAVVNLERELGQLRESDDMDPDEERAVKNDLREARRVYREQREATPQDGDAVAEPDTVTGTVTGKAGD